MTQAVSALSRVLKSESVFQSKLKQLLVYGRLLTVSPSKSQKYCFVATSPEPLERCPCQAYWDPEGNADQKHITTNPSGLMTMSMQVRKNKQPFRIAQSIGNIRVYILKHVTIM